MVHPYRHTVPIPIPAPDRGGPVACLSGAVAFSRGVVWRLCTEYISIHKNMIDDWKKYQVDNNIKINTNVFTFFNNQNTINKSHEMINKCYKYNYNIITNYLFRDKKTFIVD